MAVRFPNVAAIPIVTRAAAYLLTPLETGFVRSWHQKCVGCGLCQTRCHAINVKTKHLLSESAVVIEAGPGKEDRITSGSYLALRAAEERQREAKRKEQTESKGDSGSYPPDFLK